ncbi:hypothetical protein [Cryobacterium sp. TMT3-29-2]|nr:hypothetical protein [Cryobacterium sp. TMT3-29-2]
MSTSTLSRLENGQRRAQVRWNRGLD